MFIVFGIKQAPGVWMIMAPLSLSSLTAPSLLFWSYGRVSTMDDSKGMAFG